MNLGLTYKLGKRHFGAAVGALLATGTGLFLLLHLLGDLPAAWSFDLFTCRRTPTVPEEVVIVYLDAASHDELKQPLTETWDRAIHAQLLDRLRAEQAKLVVFDIVFDAPGRKPESDPVFASAIKANGHVILTGTLDQESTQRKRDRVLRPLDSLLAGAAGWGLDTLPSGTAIRQLLPRLDDLPCLSWVAAQKAGAAVTQAAPPSGLWLSYYGPPGTLNGLSYHQVIHTNDLPPGALKDKIVFVGAHQSVGFSGTG